MKKIKFFALMLLAGATLFTSCKGDDDEPIPAPTVTFQGGVTSMVFTGTNEIDINVTFAAEGKIESVTLAGPSLTGAGTATSTITTKMGTSGTDDAKGETSATYLFKVTAADLILAFVNHTSLSYTFTVTDQESSSNTGTFTVTMQSTGTPIGAIDTYTGVTLGAQSNATLGSFYATSSNSIYLMSAAATNCANVDIAYFYGATNHNTVGAPENADVQTVFSSVSSWTTKNSTLFVKNPSGFTFASIDATTDISGLTFGTETKANELAAGDLVAFKTAANKIGFASVTAVAADNTGSITFSVKVQQ